MAEGLAIELKDVELSFEGRPVLNGFNLEVEAGRKLSLVGESSSGKSTLLKVMVGLWRPARGLVRIFGQDLSRLGPPDLRRLRQRIGMQFQSGALFDSLTVLENLLLARRESARDPEAKARAGRTDEALKLLSAVGLGSAAGRRPFELSGGMRKRAALARAITTDPELAIFDEPTAGLDPVTSSRIIKLIQSVSQASGATMILATTDVQAARSFSSELVVMNQGRLWAHDRLEQLQKSSDDFTRRILGRLLQ
ncbi:MAG: ATP-binding cassette domain-containing protein [Candidatus Adiutrix sp.]|jgi:phospholipid/cholesterol/gamma-HCH transport system ATP-binding protein|nr:ATP-binding cassette domain-containing protein [Candidatus Adiutrix sp.]